MNMSQRRRMPAIKCWIKHLFEGQFLNIENMLNTIFGRVKRVRIIGTIIEKRVKVNTQIPINGNSQYNPTNLKIEFDLDDGTGIIQANKWDADSNSYKDIEKGDLVDLVGLINYKYNNLSISIEIIKKIYNPNKILLMNAELIKKIKLGEINTFQKKEEAPDIDLLFMETPDSKIDQFKNKVFSIIKNNSKSGNGISFTDLMKKTKISESKLRRYVRDLEIESRIYQSEENFYQSYNII